MTFRHSHHKNRTLKSDRLNTCLQLSEPRIESLKSDRVNGPLKITSNQMIPGNDQDTIATNQGTAGCKLHRTN